MKIANLLIGLFLLVAFAAAGPIENLKVGEWYEVPNSHLNSVAPQGWSANVIDPWSSGAFDTQRDRLIVWGGGHGDYSGNEIYVFDLNTLTWSLASNPSNPPAKDTPYAADGGPCSRHTYDYIQYVASIDRFCSFGGAGFYQTGQTGTNNTDCFDFAAGSWEKKAVMPGSGGLIGSISAVDGKTGKAWAHGTGGYSWLVEWNPTADSWTPHGQIWQMEDLSYSTTAAIDSKRSKMIAIGGGKVFEWDLTKTGNFLATELSTTGASSMVGAGNPGLEYDPKSDRMVAWNGGATVYLLDLDTKAWTQKNPASTNTVTPTAHAQWGTYGRFRYSPNKNVFVAVNAINQNVFIYRLTAGTAEESKGQKAPLDMARGRNGKGQIQVSPNPAKGLVRFAAQEASSFEVFNIMGIRIARVGEDHSTWDASKVPAGLYVVKTGSGARSLSKTVLVAR